MINVMTRLVPVPPAEDTVVGSGVEDGVPAEADGPVAVNATSAATAAVSPRLRGGGMRKGTS
ncbi:hypothetical protein ACWCPM_28450 [Streptomyces sp. NPDC002309]